MTCLGQEVTSEFAHISGYITKMSLSMEANLSDKREQKVFKNEVGAECC